MRLAFTRGDVSGTAVIAPDDPLGSLPRIHAEDCLAERVAEVVSIVPGDAVTVAQEGGEPVAHLPVTLTPTGAAGGVSIPSIGRITVAMALERLRDREVPAHTRLLSPTFVPRATTLP